MSIVELREKIFKKLESVDDYLLREILGIIELEDVKKQEVLVIPEEHKEDIEIGLAQLKSNYTVTNEEVDKKVKKWLDK